MASACPVVEAGRFRIFFWSLTTSSSARLSDASFATRLRGPGPCALPSAIETSWGAFLTLLADPAEMPTVRGCLEL